LGRSLLDATVDVFMEDVVDVFMEDVVDVDVEDVVNGGTTLVEDVDVVDVDGAVMVNEDVRT